MSAAPILHQRKLAALLAGMALLLLMAIAAGWYLQRLSDEADDSRHASSQRLLMLEKLLGSLHAAETAQRGFLITSNARYIEPFDKAHLEAHAHLQELGRMYASDPLATELLMRLSRWQRLKLEELEDAIGAQRTVGRDVAEFLANVDNGRRYMIQIRQEIGALEAIEASGNAALRELIARRRTATFAAALALIVVALSACVIVFRLLRREARLREALHEQMAHAAFHDALTTLPNRRYLLEELERAMQRARRRGTKVALLFIDLDGFKRVNDGLGHELGDELLKRATAQFVRTVRQSDFLARLGGDEFAVVTEVDTRNSAIALGERLVRALGMPLLDGHADMLVSASIGVAVYPHDGADTSTLLARADEAMYCAKRLGKARVATLDGVDAGAARTPARPADITAAVG